MKRDDGEERASRSRDLLASFLLEGELEERGKKE